MASGSNKSHETVEPPPQPYRVLLIENDPAEVRMVRDILSGEKKTAFELTQCASRLEPGMEAVDFEAVDIVLFDLSLPGSRGLDAFRLIRERAPHLPVIVLSGVDAAELSLQTLQEGAQDYLVKGQFDAQLLLHSMRYAIERSKAERALKRERNLLNALLDNVPDRIYFKDRESRFIRVNSAMLKLFKLGGMSEIIGRTDFAFFTAEHAQQAFDDEKGVMLSGQPIIGKIEKETMPDGSVGWASTTKMPLRDKRGTIIGTFGVSRDITEQKLAEEGLLKANAALAGKQEELLKALEDLKKAHEELRSAQLQLIEAEKMKSIGRLAAGVAHEVKNPLAIITMGVDYLSHEKFSNDSHVPGVLQDIYDAVKRADAVIRGLLDFSLPKKLEAEDVNLNEVIEQALLLARVEMKGTGFRIVKELQGDLPVLKLDPVKAGQAFLNVLTNAIHAMGEGGTLTVRTFAKQLTGVGPNVGDSRSESFRVGGTVVVAEIEDSGLGIPEDKLTKVFDPFFTTKPTGRGTGLGLSVTKSIIDLHGGTIEIRNRSEGGVKVTIMFGA